MGCDPIDIGKTIHPHPTLSESIGMAAEVFRRRVHRPAAIEEKIMHDAAQGMWQREADSICFASKQMLSVGGPVLCARFW